MFHITIKIEFSIVLIILFFFLYKLSLQYTMTNENDNLEYREKLREYIGYYANTIPPTIEINNNNNNSTKFSIFPERFKNNISLASTTFNPDKNIKILDLWSMEHVNNVQIPALCKDFPSSETSIPQAIYCISLIVLWLLLLATALAYQLRKFQKIKTINNDIELGEIQREI